MIFDAIRRWLGSSPGGDGPRGKGDGGAPDGDGAGSLSCQEALARLYEYLDAELADVSHEEVERHFRICARCYPHLKLENAFREALHRAVEGQRAPEGLRSRILAIMGGEPPPA